MTDDNGTRVRLREYIERILEEREKAHRAEWIASEKALDAAAEALSARLETMNEFRAQINAERALYVRREELKPLVDWQANMQGRFWMLGAVLAVLTTALTVALHFVR